MKCKFFLVAVALMLVLGVGCASLIDEPGSYDVLGYENRDWSGLIPKRDIIDLGVTGRARAGNEAVIMYGPQACRRYL